MRGARKSVESRRTSSSPKSSEAAEESSSGSRLLEVYATAVEVEAPGRRPRLGPIMATAAARFASRREWQRDFGFGPRVKFLSPMRVCDYDLIVVWPSPVQVDLEAQLLLLGSSILSLSRGWIFLAQCCNF